MYHKSNWSGDYSRKRNKCRTNAATVMLRPEKLLWKRRSQWSDGLSWGRTFYWMLPHGLRKWWVCQMLQDDSSTEYSNASFYVQSHPRKSILPWEILAFQWFEILENKLGNYFVRVSQLDLNVGRKLPYFEVLFPDFALLLISFKYYLSYLLESYIAFSEVNNYTHN